MWLLQTPDQSADSPDRHSVCVSVWSTTVTMSMRCDTCQVSLNSSGQYQQHLGGKAHAKRLKLIASGGAPPPG